MKKNIVMYVSSLTGNTEKIADAIARSLEEAGTRVHLYKNEKIEVISQEKKYEDADGILVCFWCRKGSLDDKSRHTLELMKGKDILAIGTMGYYPESEYGELVRNNVTQEINQNNHCLGVFLSQGKIDEARTEKRRQLPPESPHYLDDEGYQRHLESRKHPNEEDIQAAIRFVGDGGRFYVPGWDIETSPVPHSPLLVPL